MRLFPLHLPASFELVGDKDIAEFDNTTNPPLTPEATLPKAEHANYYDFGVAQKVARGLTLGIDTYYSNRSI